MVRIAVIVLIAIDWDLWDIFESPATFIHVASPPQSLTSLWMHDLHTASCESPVTQSTQPEAGRLFSGWNLTTLLSTISWFGEMMKPPNFDVVWIHSHQKPAEVVEVFGKDWKRGTSGMNFRDFRSLHMHPPLVHWFFLRFKAGDPVITKGGRSCFEHAVNDSSHVETTWCSLLTHGYSLKSLQAGEALQNSRWAVRNLRNLLWCRFDWDGTGREW